MQIIEVFFLVGLVYNCNNRLGSVCYFIWMIWIIANLYF